LNLYVYSIFRLILIALMITYFIACIFYYISTEADQAQEHDNANGAVVIEDGVHDTFLNAFLVQRDIWGQS